MKQSTNRILTTHVGSLSRPADLIALYREQAPPEKLDPRLTTAVAEVVQLQIDAGIDIVNDGEFGKPVFDEVDYGAWASYIHQRITGSEMRDLPADFNIGTSIMAGSKDRADFAEFYQSDEGGAGFRRRPLRYPMNVGPIRYTGHALVQRDIRNLKAALAGQKAEDAFLTAAVTGVSVIPGEYYKNPEEQGAAIAEAMREEYKAITDAGINVQLDDPIIVNVYEWQYSMSGDMAAFRKWAEKHVELVNHALEGIPEEKVRYHICWGSWKGPHSTDLPLRDVIDLVLKVKASQYSVEAANPQHEHEWKVWRDVKLPAGKAVIPGVVTHKTNVLEHPEGVADRIVRYAEAVGRENVIAGTDCGMGGRIHPTVAWAKLRALSAGAALATKQLWRS
ncbi:MAG TPA: cobalamin-independent methionine synthase II family protein [Bryobacteraceae bacterium]|jgi:5-methyltetrahydropteroyltriglutamate--homocysteine methyltransferase|nr:cobalamin-independent methionine synthase II family protein [Bryobacteraceae bacterium]